MKKVMRETQHAETSSFLSLREASGTLKYFRYVIGNIQ